MSLNTSSARCMPSGKGLINVLIIFLLNNKIIISSNLDGTNRSLESPEVVDRLVNILMTERNNLVDQHARLNTDRQELTEKRRQVRQVVDPRELVRLNVGGRIFVTRRETLTKVSDGSYGTTLQRDFDGSYFLDYNPTLFSHLLDQLRVMEINETTVFVLHHYPHHQPKHLIKCCKILALLYQEAQITMLLH